MEAMQQYYPSIPLTGVTKKTIIHRFFDWCKAQENNRLLWLAIIIAAHGCFLTPVTVMFVMLSGNSMILWGFALGAMAMSLVSNLAALPTKFTLPVFFVRLLIDAAIIGISIVGMLQQ
jgi:hypothetical protein